MNENLFVHLFISISELLNIWFVEFFFTILDPQTLVI
jgi:hypothetical protein